MKRQTKAVLVAIIIPFIIDVLILVISSILINFGISDVSTDFIDGVTMIMSFNFITSYMIVALIYN